MLGDEITLTLNSPITDEELDLLTDVDMENTPRIIFHTKNGKEVEYLKVVRCKDCRHYRFHDGTFGKGWMCFECNTARHGDDYCSRGERRSE